MSLSPESAALYIVGTPIGNAEDLTYRAMSCLSQVDLILCEDTRVTARLLQHLRERALLVSDEHLPLKSCHAHNERARAEQILVELQAGKNVAYVSDAGTPGLSDPGNLLCETISQAGYRVLPVPGVSALTCLVSICGFNLSKGFFFAGFLPRTAGKLSRLVESHKTIFAFESPYRIRKSVALIAEIVPESELCLGRELTKKHEQIIKAKASDLAQENLVEKGEFILAIHQPKWKRKKASEQE